MKTLILLMSMLIASSGIAGSLEYKLAVIDGVATSESDVSVARFRSLLKQLSYTFVENKQQIADMTVKARNRLRDAGVRQDLLGIMEGVNQLFSSRVDNQEYAEYVAVYVVLRKRGQSHTAALSGLRSMLDALGA